MKGITLFAAPMLLSAISQAQTDGGGRDVRIALFSAQPPRTVVVAAAGPGAWWSPCVTCAHQPLPNPLHMPAVREIIAGGPLSIRDEEHAQNRTANGLWHLRVAKNGLTEVVLSLPSERYVAAVLMGETAAGEPLESLRAMAVVARTFVLQPGPAKPLGGHVASDVCDSTACQALKLGPVSAAVEEAVRSTAGETLWFGSRRAGVFFSEHCGGTTEAAGAVWPRLAGTPYLRSKPDPYCLRSDRAAWHGEVSVSHLQQVAMEEGWHMPAEVVTAAVAERTGSLRARTVVLTGERGERSMIAAPALRLAVGRALGWNILRSDLYDLRLRDGVLVFDGRGHGHGVGLCQRGATEMARLGKGYREILNFYLPGTAVRVMPQDSGWQQRSSSGIRFSSTAPLTALQMQAAVEAWTVARSRFAVSEPISPWITFAPTTQVFRQLTGQPGWQVASTSGANIVLQPITILARNGVMLGPTLQHEMLHVAVEASAGANTPLWLREGLVEVLSGEAPREAPALSAEDTERMLKSTGSWQGSREAHRAAAARVRLLMERYGMPAVRGWLIAGSAVPSN